jgi:type VI secretion system secreted protein VgrG
VTMFELRLRGGADLEVVGVEATEALSDAYRFTLTTRTALDSDLLDGLEHEVLGARASLVIGGEDGRVVHGLVTGVHGLRPRGDTAEVLIDLEPRLALLRLRERSRIFQELSLPAIVEAVLAEWGLSHALEIQGQHRKQRYVTQYEESDFAFLQRLVGRAGLFFFFEQPEDGDEERLIVADSVGSYRPLAGGDALRYAPDGDALTGLGLAMADVLTFDRNRRLRPKQVLLADFDPRHPNLPMRAQAKLDAPPSAAGGEPLSMMHHAQRGENEPDASPLDVDARAAARVLAAHRSGVWEGVGESRVRRLEVGRAFTLSGHPVGGNNRAQVITRLEHRGRLPEVGGEIVYENRFVTTTAETLVLLPPFPALRRQVAETATVVGPDGEDIYTDDLGRIRVRFHWDGEERGEQSSCWLRVAQAWAGTHFGMQLIPRVGMEVVVTFLGGDPDRPIVTGTVYNGTHPTPFELPGERARSGLRTQSVPSSDGGFNELSFRDDAGREQIFVRAERDLDVEVGGRHFREVAGDETIDVAGHQTLEIAKNRTLVVEGQSVHTAVGGYQLRAQGGGAFSIGGDADFSIGQQLTTKIEGAERREVKGSVSEEYAEDVTVRVLGHHTTVVGRHDARKSFTLHTEGTITTSSSGTTLLSSDKDVVIACGDSQIRLTPDGIELRGPKLRIDAPTAELGAKECLTISARDDVTVKAKKILLESESAFLGLAKVAKLDGEKVKLNCEPDPVDELEPPEPPKPTIIELCDEKGRPMAKQRFIVVLPDGSEQSGTLDEEGRAELVLEGSGKVVFPDVDEPRKR